MAALMKYFEEKIVKEIEPLLREDLDKYFEPFRILMTFDQVSELKQLFHDLLNHMKFYFKKYEELKTIYSKTDDQNDEDLDFILSDLIGRSKTIVYKNNDIFYKAYINAARKIMRE